MAHLSKGKDVILATLCPSCMVGCLYGKPPEWQGLQSRFTLLLLFTHNSDGY